MIFEDFKRKYQKREVEELAHQVLDKPLLSVCVQTFQHHKYIKTCLDSILNQNTDFDFELLIGDDASTDGTREICEEYARLYPNKVRLFLHKRENNISINGNPSGRFNYLYNLYNSRGNYIAVCEGDDYWTDPLKLQKQVDFLKANKDINLCFHKAHILKNDDLTVHKIPELFLTSSFNYIELIKYYNFIATASVVYVKPNPFNIPDWFMKTPFGDLGIYKIVSGQNKFQCINDIMCVYRVHDQGAWSGLNEFNAQQNYLSFYKLIENELNPEEKKVVASKMKAIYYKMSTLKFPKKPWLQKMYNLYLRLKVLI